MCVYLEHPYVIKGDADKSPVGIPAMSVMKLAPSGAAEETSP
jgi:hypothetical protein